MTNISDEIAASMQQYMQQTDPVPGFMRDVATGIAGVAQELDSAGSPLTGEVDQILVEFANIASGG